MNCQFSQLPDGRWHCPACGYVSKRARDKPPNKTCGTVPRSPLALSEPAPAFGPGAEIAAIFKAAGAKSDQCGGVCQWWQDQMNRWGVDGCREHRQEIIDRIKQAAYKTWVTDQMRIGWSISREPWFNPLDPVGCIADEAIRRATASLGSGS